MAYLTVSNRDHMASSGWSTNWMPAEARLMNVRSARFSAQANLDKAEVSPYVENRREAYA